MSGETLEAPASPDELYLASCPDDVEACRPLLTGDIFRNVVIPGLDEASMGMVLTHPCSMRVDGLRLADRLLMARVSAAQPIPLSKWSTGHFKVMPLPDLGGEFLVAKFDEIGLVPTEGLVGSERVACLTPFGVNLLQQRFIWHLTRFVAPTFLLNESCAAVFEEADLCEEWVVEVTESDGVAIEEAATEFHEWIRSLDASGVVRQDQLREPQRRSSVRKDMRRTLAHRREN